MRARKNIFIFHASAHQAALLRFVLDIRMRENIHVASSLEEFYAKSAGKDLLVHFRRTVTEVIRYDGTPMTLPSYFPRCDLIEALRLSLARRRGPTTAAECGRRYTAKKAYGDLYRQRLVAA